MTSYVRKTNTFDELLIESTTNHRDVATFLGQSHDANKLSFQGAGFVGNSLFAVLLGRPDLPNGVEVIYGNTDGYLRAERRGDGLTVNISYSSNSLSSDSSFSLAP